MPVDEVILHDALTQGAARTLSFVPLAAACFVFFLGIQKTGWRRVLLFLAALLLIFIGFTISAAAPLLPVG